MGIFNRQDRLFQRSDDIRSFQRHGGYVLLRTEPHLELGQVALLLSFPGSFRIGNSFSRTLWLIVISEILLGVGTGALLIPIFQNTLDVARQEITRTLTSILLCTNTYRYTFYR